MSISNEVVKFIAEIELDAQDRENFLQGLKECDKECSDLRDGILHLQNSLTKLRTEGKEDTKEFRRHRCNSFYFYIKPQQFGCVHFSGTCCNSFYFYIKPQPDLSTQTQPQVVIHSISTSNHNIFNSCRTSIRL